MAFCGAFSLTHYGAPDRMGKYVSNTPLTSLLMVANSPFLYD
jgi:hypothetical protein